MNASEPDRFRFDSLDDTSGIAYGVSLAVTAIIVLGVAWISMSPVVDELHSLVVELNAEDSSTYTDQLVTKMTDCTNIWGYIVFLFVAVPFTFAIVRAVRRQAYDD